MGIAALMKVGRRKSPSSSCVVNRDARPMLSSPPPRQLFASADRGGRNMSDFKALLQASGEDEAVEVNQRA